jgi:hypothetical protein
MADERSTRNDGDGRKGFLLRLPPDLLAELRRWANQEVRSLNGHIEYLLREALRRRRGEDRPDGP